MGFLDRIRKDHYSVCLGFQRWSDPRGGGWEGVTVESFDVYADCKNEAIDKAKDDLNRKYNDIVQHNIIIYSANIV